MNWKRPFRHLALVALLPLAACGKQAPAPVTDGVTDAMLVSAPKEEWLSYGRDYAEQRFSPLDQITPDNVGQLGLAWTAEFDTARGQEATPLMHDGVLYVSTAWSKVNAYDARTGQLKWSYDPKVPRDTLVRACCDAVNRGVALYGDKVYVGTLDGRLVALKQADGSLVFERRVVPDEQNYTITGAPRVANGRVFLGEGGAEFKARGYLAAYDAQTGEELWKFHTVPGNPADGFENAAMEKAARTWAGEWWKLGGGGTVWDAITYDPTTGLVLFGTGNAEPWNPKAAGREGDSLYTSSIVAVNADTGEYAWHFQETPEDRWDFDSNAQITLADLTIDGKPRRVALHAPKNGHVYVLDARTGEFLGAKPFVAPINWTTGIDPKTGKATINPEARYEVTGKPFVSLPGAVGAHSWQPQSFSPKTNLLYIPVNYAGFGYLAAQDWKPTDIGFQTGMDMGAMSMPADAKVRAAASAATVGALVAIDPITGKQAWKFAYPGPSNGGILSTAGNLVFQGSAGGEFTAFTADAGKKLWSFRGDSGIIAGPITYMIDGVQYVAVVQGWGGVWDLSAGALAHKSGKVAPIGRLLVFKIGGGAKLPPTPAMAERVLDPPPFTGTPEIAAKGKTLFGRYCFVCHGDAGMAGSLTPDLRHTPLLDNADAFKAVVIDGSLAGNNGMVSFKSALSPDDADAIRHYLIQRANEDKALGAH